MSKKINHLITYFLTKKFIDYLNNVSIYKMKIKIPTL